MAEHEYLKFSRKFSWRNAVLFVIFWLMIYIGIVMPEVKRLPHALKISDEIRYPDDFIAERAKNMLQTVTYIGARTVGSEANELVTIEVLKTQIDRIKNVLHPSKQLQVDVQVASGNFSIDDKMLVYRSVQNFIVKLSARQGATQHCILLNSHFDTTPQSPGAGDGASMVAVMLEVLRVLAKSPKPMRHAVVFLFNGAEEPGWLGSHAFSTQHMWAKDCRVFINLDAAGWGGPLLLFQVANNQRLLLDFYSELPQTFASSFYEEIFKTGLIFSNTDFRVLNHFGGMPGFDMALISNGYVYHTKFDRHEHYSKPSLQHTGNNVLALVRALLGGLQKFDTAEPLVTEKMVYFDIFGYTLALYPVTVGGMVNITVCLTAGFAIFLSLLEYGFNSKLSLAEVLTQFFSIMLVQIFSLIVGASAVIIVAALLSNYSCALSWFTYKWLLLGLYFCPMFFGMLMVPAITLKHIEYNSFDLNEKLKLLLHAHCVWVIMVTLILTVVGVRSAYLGMIAVAFYALAVWINLCTDDRGSAHGYWFLVPTVACQIVPFAYFTSLTYRLYETLVPIMGRSCVQVKPELLMAGIAILMSSLFAGFIMPVFQAFEKTKRIAAAFAIFTWFSLLVVAFSPAARFKYQSSVQRFAVYHEHRIFHSLTHDTIEEAVIRVRIFDQSIRNVGDLSKILSMNDEISQSLDLASTCSINGELNFCIPISRPLAIAADRYPKLKVLNITDVSKNPVTRRFNFQLEGPTYTNASLTLVNAKIVDWSFAKKTQQTSQNFPLQFKFVSARNGGPFKFYLTLETFSSSALVLWTQASILAYTACGMMNNVIILENFGALLALSQVMLLWMIAWRPMKNGAFVYKL